MQSVKTKVGYVEGLIQTLYELNLSQAEDTFQSCKILAAIKEQKLYTLLNFESFKEFIHNTDLIRQSPSTCNKMANLYIYAKDFGYSQKECIEILESLSANAMHGQLARDDKKSTPSAFVKRCRKDYLSSKYQMNVCYDSKKDLDTVHKALAKHGMEFDENGQRHYSSEALLALAKAAK